LQRFTGQKDHWSDRYDCMAELGRFTVRVRVRFRTKIGLKVKGKGKCHTLDIAFLSEGNSL